MTHEQVGKYIRLLCLMHQTKGTIDIPAFDAYIGNDPAIRAKFSFKDGYVYHDRLISEMERRQAFCESRRINRTKGKQKDDICSTSVGHMETETETETKAVNTTIQPIKIAAPAKPKKQPTFVRDNPPTLEEVTPYCTEKGIDPQQFHDAGTAVGWVDKNKTPYRDWKAVVRKWVNYRKATGPIPSVTPSKPPVAIAVATQLAMPRPGMTIPDIDREIMQKLVGTYSEHAVIEALGHARGKVK